MSPDWMIFVYVFSLLAGLSGTAIYYELRSRRFEPVPSKDHIFRCEKCGFVYTDDADVDCSRCPQCRAMNEAIDF